MSRPLRRADGIFRELYEQTHGVKIDFASFDRARFPQSLLQRAQRIWQERVQSEFRSVQIMTRLLQDTLAAGDPLEIYSGIAELIQDEIHHVALCASMTRALGVEAVLPDPLEVQQKEQFLKLTAAERALATAIAMLAVNETLSVGFIMDLRSRATDPIVKAVLDATVDDEEGHEAFGWEYIRKSLERFPKSTLPSWQRVAQQALEPHRRMMELTLRDVPEAKRQLDAWPDQELVSLGLFSQERQALVLEQTLTTKLAPRLKELGLY